MRYAIAIPQYYSDGSFDPGAFREYLARAEEAGYHSAWTQEAVFGRRPQLSPMEAMTFAAACTDTLRLGCTVFVSTLHIPAQLAKSTASLDQLSRGRLEMGVGSGGKNRPYAAFGMQPDRYLARFTEGVELLKALWTQETVDHDGDFWQLSGAGITPRPFQKPHPPLWFGGSGPKALRRALDLGTGFFGAGSTPTTAFADQVRFVRSENPRPDFEIAKRVYIAIDADAARARERVNAELTALYGGLSPDVEAAAIAGTPDDCVRAVREVLDAGAELVLFTPLFDQAEHADLIAREIIPALG
ncbi:LLM class flavin-dependent oxidoreductase [Amycolatopsis sp. FDAARGOS 1241]|uniref:LLM class flavin-dependent oxidoreductase n=1 Tax=Amycolatopsis sp. FDAARGOS 1241 TaxID=2778070 RepID=UPI00194E442F|nr:LLM class flavin-dependent oxidoreductase [Amycolatopsis sp. FDAARGOS 1241]QRP48453.1 LLM class flavin-dependent oxidoreductase [Amycolatopsis sp. FDAARGOS 1241]